MLRRALIAAAAVLGAVAVAGCGSQGVASPTPNTVVGTLVTAPAFPIVPAFHLKGDPKKGSAIYASNSCGGCHTLAAAHSTGTVGPNLDQLKPSYRDVTAQVTNGGGAMPAFKDSLTPQQIADVSAYVVDSTGGKAP
ncbi:MAG TPA: c-type cytochrome [Gaiellaceae bacterium]|nr:c-type cytochrome [Gaiellaceae bacterium]